MIENQLIFHVTTGPGGLYAALILADLGIPFKIIEGRDRVGGRLYTHTFDNETGAPYNYFDVGAMRFPKISSMQRVFHLFHYQRLNENGLALAQKLKRYIFECPNELLSYNGVTVKRIEREHQGDPFLSEAVILDTPELRRNAYIAATAECIVDDVIRPFAIGILNDLRNGGHQGWEDLQAFDKYSARAYMSTFYRPSASLRARYPGIPDEALPTDVVNWCETFKGSTGSYDRAFTEMVLGAVAFGWQPTREERENIDWYYIE